MVYTSPLKIDGLVQMIFLFKGVSSKLGGFFWGERRLQRLKQLAKLPKVKLLELRQGDRICVRAGEAGCFRRPITDGSVMACNAWSGFRVDLFSISLQGTNPYLFQWKRKTIDSKSTVPLKGDMFVVRRVP